MRLSSTFPVPAPADKTFALFFDAATMRACVPGCEQLEQVDERTYRGQLVNEIAHVKFRANFSATIESTNEPTSPDEPYVVRALLKGEDRRLGSTIKINASLSVQPDGPDACTVSYEMEMAIWGKLGRLGESVIRRRSMEVEQRFAEALAAAASGQPIPEAPTRSKSSRVAAATPPQPGEAAAAPSPTTTVTPAQAAGPQTRGSLRDDLPFLVALVAAALGWGIILGGRRRAR